MVKTVITVFHQEIFFHVQIILMFHCYCLGMCVDISFSGLNTSSASDISFLCLFFYLICLFCIQYVCEFACTYISARNLL